MCLIIEKNLNEKIILLGFVDTEKNRKELFTRETSMYCLWKINE